MSDNTTTEAVVIERIIGAPVDVLWRMWTKPVDFQQWYGPQGASVPVAELDVRVGGQRLICMEMDTPDGTRQMWTVGEHLEVVANKRLVYTESHSDEHGNVVEMPGGEGGDTPHSTKVIVTLEDLGDRTRMVLRHEGIPADSPGRIGWEQALDKLEAKLA